MFCIKTVQSQEPDYFPRKSKFNVTFDNLTLLKNIYFKLFFFFWQIPNCVFNYQRTFYLESAGTNLCSSRSQWDNLKISQSFGDTANYPDQSAACIPPNQILQRLLSTQAGLPHCLVRSHLHSHTLGYKDLLCPPPYFPTSPPPSDPDR